MQIFSEYLFASKKNGANCAIKNKIQNKESNKLFLIDTFINMKKNTRAERKEDLFVNKINWSFRQFAYR